MKHFLKGILFFIVTFSLINCTEDDDTSVDVTGKMGTANFEITDGPADDANVKGAFVTVTEVRVDGQAISNFSGKQTIDLMAYQNGDTRALGLAELETGTYSNVSLVLDYEQDANGNAPGCYVLTTDNVKHNLQASASASNEIILNTGSFVVEEGSTTDLVIDFDLRKAIRYEETPSSNDGYDFVTDNEVRTSLRLVAKSRTGQAKGQCDDNLGIAGDRIVVYAYKKGTYDRSVEMSGQGQSQIQFKNAVSSATVNAQGEYTLAFLEEGEYELHFIGYEDDDNDGRSEVKGELQLDLLGNLGIDLNSVTVNANASVSINVLVTGILP